MSAAMNWVLPTMDLYKDIAEQYAKTAFQPLHKDNLDIETFQYILIILT